MKNSSKFEESYVLSLYEKSGALKKGHFCLTSGLHSDTYLQSALVLSRPDYAEQFGQALAARFFPIRDDIDVVAAPAVGGIIIAHEVGRALGKPVIFAERLDGALKFKRGFKADCRALLVEDVVTTGGSLDELAKLTTEVDRCCLLNRGRREIVSLLKLETNLWQADECKLCEENQPEYLGSRR